MKALNLVTLALIIVGAVNWLLVGLFQFDLVAAIFGGQSTALSRIVYILVGLSGLYQIIPLVSAFASNEDHVQVASPRR
jgi:uncharacterized protein